jgi:hypothetical protein
MVEGERIWRNLFTCNVAEMFNDFFTENITKPYLLPHELDWSHFSIRNIVWLVSLYVKLWLHFLATKCKVMESIIFILVPGIFVDKSNLFLLQLLKNIEIYAFVLSRMIKWSYVLDAIHNRRVLRSCSRMLYLWSVGISFGVFRARISTFSAR